MADKDNDYTNKDTKLAFATWYLLNGTDAVDYHELMDDEIYHSFFIWDEAKADGLITDGKDSNGLGSYKLTPKGVAYAKGELDA